jgi:hypothetical protein
MMARKSKIESELVINYEPRPVASPPSPEVVARHYIDSQIAILREHGITAEIPADQYEAATGPAGGGHSYAAISSCAASTSRSIRPAGIPPFSQLIASSTPCV